MGQRLVKSDHCDEMAVVSDIEKAVPGVLKLSQQERKQLQGFLVSRCKTHSGPLPAPEDLAIYNQVIPNGAERIMQMAEKQIDHRMKMERVTIPWEIVQNIGGQFCALIVTVLGLGGGGYLVYLGHDVAGGAAITTTIGTLAIAYLKKPH